MNFYLQILGVGHDTSQYDYRIAISGKSCMEILSKEELKKRILLETSSPGSRKKPKQFEIVEIHGGYRIDNLACIGLPPSLSKFLLLVCNGLTYPECAEHLGITKGTAQKKAADLILKLCPPIGSSNADGKMAATVTEAFRRGILSVVTITDS